MRVCIISSQASSPVVIPHVSCHPSILHTSSVLINCISKQSFYQHGRAFGVFVSAALMTYWYTVLTVDGLLSFIVYKCSILCDV